MLAKRIIPCLDVKDGRVVKGVKFGNLRDAGDPVAIACIYEEEEADEIVFYDITASYERRNIMIEVVQRTAERVFMPLTVGGGIRTVQDMRALLTAGADKVSINSAAIRNPDLIRESADRFGSQCIVVSIDAKRLRSNGSRKRWQVYLDGGRIPTELEAVSWAQRAEELGAGELVLNSIDADGTKIGYDLKLTRIISETVSIPIVASGGAGTLEHLYEALTIGKADAALAASIFHYRKYTIHEAKRYLRQRGIVVR